MSAESKPLPDRVAALEHAVKSIRPARDGRDGRDGDPGVPGIGELGPRGRDGRAGKDADPDLIVRAATEAAERAVAALPIPRDGVDGRDGADAEPAAVVALVERAVAEIPRPADGRHGKDGIAGVRGPKGDKGDRGDRGPVGPMPRHEWRDKTKLRFESPDGEWGDFHDLRGPRGVGGGGGGSTGNEAPPFDLDSLGIANPLITPQEIIVKQNGVWLRMTWGAFIDLLPSGPPSSQSYADDYATNYT